MAENAFDPTAGQLRELRRFRWVATSLLILAAAIYVALARLEDPSVWMQLFKAASEAALVGGLADWFAVTAIFRRPMGLPIPHTAVIPNNKDRIGAGLGAFIERNFMDPDLVVAKLRSLDPAKRVAGWLADPERAHRLADRTVALLPYAIENVEDHRMRAFIRMALRRQLDAFEPAPMLGRMLELLRQSEKHHELFDHMVVALRDLLVRNESLLYDMVAERSRWWVPRRIDRRMAEALLEGVRDLLDDLGRRDHEVRTAYEHWLSQFIADLQTSPELKNRVRAGLREVVGNRELQEYAAALWTDSRALLLADLAKPHSAIRNGLAGAYRSIGQALLRDAQSRERLNARVEEAARALVVPWRGEIGRFIADVVRSWEASSVAERMELAVGRDLQYIRINGTIVGAAVGCVLFALTHLLT